MKKFIFILFWIVSLIAASIYTYENPEALDRIKNSFAKHIPPKVQFEQGPSQRAIGNSFAVEFSEVISFSEKTAFIIYNNDTLDFDKENLKVYFQNGYFIENLKLKKINLPNNFTTSKNGGVKTIFVLNKNEFALISSKKNKCFYSSVVSLSNRKELFNTECLPEKKIDYNGLGSSNIHKKDILLFSIGTPEMINHQIAKLAQDDNSMYGKILQINKNDLNNIVLNEEGKLNVKIYTKGHRNPQGLTKINESIFSVEHGPKGGDELNKIIEGKNYGWPEVSYGTKYGYDKEKKSYEINHKKNNFEEPLFALVPSVGISALNSCPKKLKNHYQKPCLLALSLYGNDLRPGRSIIVYLLNEKMDKVHSIEKIYLRDDLKLRHFVTNSKNELYEDEEGNIYISADRKGIYKISFTNFTK